MTRVRDLKRICADYGLSVSSSSSTITTIVVRDDAPHIHIQLHVHGTVRVAMRFKDRWWSYTEAHSDDDAMVQAADRLFSKYSKLRKPASEMTREAQ